MKRLCLALAVALILAAYVVYPYWTLLRIESAIINRDAPALETLVDWQQLRTGLKADVRRLLAEGVTKQQTLAATGTETAGTMLGMVLGGTIVDSLIDGAVSAGGLVQAWQQKVGAGSVSKRPRDFVASATFQSLTAFRVDMRIPDDIQSPTLTLLLELAGAEWRVTRIVLPPEALQSAMAQRGHTKGNRIR